MELLNKHNNCNFTVSLKVLVGSLWCGLRGKVNHRAARCFPFETWYKNIQNIAAAFSKAYLPTLHAPLHSADSESTTAWNPFNILINLFCAGTNTAKPFPFTSSLPDRLLAGHWFRLFKQGDHILIFLLAALLGWYLHLWLGNHVRTHGSVKEVWCHCARRDKSF